MEALFLTVVDDGDSVGDEGEGEGGEDELRIDCRVGETGKIVILHEGSEDVSILRSRRGSEVSRSLRKKEDEMEEGRTGSVVLTPVIDSTRDEMLAGPGSWNASIMP